MSTLYDLAKNLLVESVSSIIVESDKANFRPFGKHEYMGYGGAETNEAVPVPMIHEHGDNHRIIVSGVYGEPNKVHIEVHHILHRHDETNTSSSAIEAHKDTWMHKASLAKKALELHGDDKDEMHSALAKHGFEKIHDDQF